MLTRLLLGFLWLAVFLFSVHLYYQDNSSVDNVDNVIARVERVSGRVLFRSVDTPIWYAAKPGETLGDNAFMSTGASASAKVELMAGGSLFIEPDSQISFSQNKRRGKDYLVNVLKGTMKVQNPVVTPKPSVKKGLVGDFFGRIVGVLEEKPQMILKAGDMEATLSSGSEIVIEKPLDKPAEVKVIKGEAALHDVNQAVKNKTVVVITPQPQSEVSTNLDPVPGLEPVMTRTPAPVQRIAWSREMLNSWAERFLTIDGPAQVEVWTPNAPENADFEDMEWVLFLPDFVSVPDASMDLVALLQGVGVEQRLPLKLIENKRFKVELKSDLLRQLFSDEGAQATLSIRVGVTSSAPESGATVAAGKGISLNFLTLARMNPQKVVLRAKGFVWNPKHPVTWKTNSVLAGVANQEFWSRDRKMLLAVAEALQGSDQLSIELVHERPNWGISALWGVRDGINVLSMRGIDLKNDLAKEIFRLAGLEILFRGRADQFISTQTCATRLRTRDNSFLDGHRVAILTSQNLVEVDVDIFRKHQGSVDLVVPDMRGCLHAETPVFRAREAK